MSRKELEQIANVCLTASTAADAIQVIVQSHDTHTTRFARSTVFQSSTQHEIEVTVRALANGRTGQAVSNQTHPRALKSLVDQAVSNAVYAACHESARLPRPQPLPEIVPPHPENPTPDQCGRLAAALVSGCAQSNVSAAGLVSATSGELLVANSLGVLACAPVHQVDANLVASREEASGYATAVTRDIGEVEPEQLVTTAVAKCLAGLNPTRVEPTTCEVILEEPAVASLLLWMSYMGFGIFGPYAAERGDSVLYNNLGRRLFGKEVTIYDDGTSPDTLTLPFDFEGMPRQRVTLIDRGTASAIVHDSATARRFDTATTGHCNIDAGVGPTPLHVFMEGGDSSVDDMIRNTADGILVTRFHGALTPLDSRDLLLTGVTRDGTFQIRDGEITGGVKNMRWTDSMLRVLSSIVDVSRVTRLNIPAQVSTISSYRVPAIKVSGFRFTDVQEF